MGDMLPNFVLQAHTSSMWAETAVIEGNQLSIGRDYTIFDDNKDHCSPELLCRGQKKATSSSVVELVQLADTLELALSE